MASLFDVSTLWIGTAVYVGIGGLEAPSARRSFAMCNLNSNVRTQLQELQSKGVHTADLHSNCHRSVLLLVVLGLRFVSAGQSHDRPRQSGTMSCILFIRMKCLICTKKHSKIKTQTQRSVLRLHKVHHNSTLQSYLPYVALPWVTLRSAGLKGSGGASDNCGLANRLSNLNVACVWCSRRQRTRTPLDIHWENTAAA